MGVLCFCGILMSKNKDTIVPCATDSDAVRHLEYVVWDNVERLDSQEPPHNLWFDIFEFAAEWGVKVSILPKSWYSSAPPFRSSSIRQSDTVDFLERNSVRPRETTAGSLEL